MPEHFLGPLYYACTHHLYHWISEQPLPKSLFDSTPNTSSSIYVTSSICFPTHNNFVTKCISSSQKNLFNMRAQVTTLNKTSNLSLQGHLYVKVFVNPLKAFFNMQFRLQCNKLTPFNPKNQTTPLTCSSQRGKSVPSICMKMMIWYEPTTLNRIISVWCTKHERIH